MHVTAVTSNDAQRRKTVRNKLFGRDKSVSPIPGKKKHPQLVETLWIHEVEIEYK